MFFLTSCPACTKLTPTQNCSRAEHSRKPTAIQVVQYHLHMSQNNGTAASSATANNTNACRSDRLSMRRSM